MLITAAVPGLSLPSSRPSLLNCLLIARAVLLPCSSCLSRRAVPGMMCSLWMDGERIPGASG